MDRTSDEFVLLLTSAQPTIYACIYALLPDRSAAQDLLQETNLTLWHKADDFESGSNFNAWATRIARYHVLNYRRKLARERVVFDDALFEELCSRQAERMDEQGRYIDALRGCIEKLPAFQQQVLHQRYSQQDTVIAMAKMHGKSVGAISQLLYRVRQSLVDCVYQRVQEGA